MTKEEQIRQGLAKLAERYGPLQTLLCKVVSVDKEEFTIVVDEDGIEIPDVRLRPVLNGKESLTIFPKPGTWVLIGRIETDADWIVLQVDEMDGYRIVNANMLFEMKDGKYLVKSGTENLGKCLDDLFNEIQLIYAPKNSAAITAIQVRLKTLLSDGT